MLNPEISYRSFPPSAAEPAAQTPGSPRRTPPPHRAARDGDPGPAPWGGRAEWPTGIASVRPRARSAYTPDARWDLLLVCVAGYILIAVGRVHQLFPVLDSLRPAI